MLALPLILRLKICSCKQAVEKKKTQSRCTSLIFPLLLCALVIGCCRVEISSARCPFIELCVERDEVVDSMFFFISILFIHFLLESHIQLLPHNGFNTFNINIIAKMSLRNEFVLMNLQKHYVRSPQTHPPPVT